MAFLIHHSSIKKFNKILFKIISSSGVQVYTNSSLVKGMGPIWFMWSNMEQKNLERTSQFIGLSNENYMVRLFWTA